MNRFECLIGVVFLAAPAGLVHTDYAQAADARARGENKTGQAGAKSPSLAKALKLERVVVTPAPEQMAKIRMERRMIGLDYRAGHGYGSGHRKATGAL